MKPPYTKQQSIDFYVKADKIYSRLCEDALNTMDALDSTYGQRKLTVKQKTMAKFYVSNAVQLSRQSLRVFNTQENFLLLACLGCRSLLEHEINSKYVFFHPRHHKDTAWLDRQSKDFWRRTRIQKAIKSSLDNKSTKVRAKEVRKLSTYNRSYAYLSGVTHSTAASATLIRDQELYNGVVWIGLHSLVLLNNVIDYVSKFHNIVRDGSIEKDIKDLVGQYR